MNRYSRLLFLTLMVLAVAPLFTWSGLLASRNEVYTISSLFAESLLSQAYNIGGNVSNVGGASAISFNDTVGLLDTYGITVLLVELNEVALYDQIDKFEEPSAIIECQFIETQQETIHITTTTNGSAVTLDSSNAARISSTHRVGVTWSTRNQAYKQAIAQVIEALVICVAFFAAQALLIQVRRLSASMIRACLLVRKDDEYCFAADAGRVQVRRVTSDTNDRFGQETG